VHAAKEAITLRIEYNLHKASLMERILEPLLSSPRSW
jgi:hypothetical protein